MPSVNPVGGRLGGKWNLPDERDAEMEVAERWIFPGCPQTSLRLRLRHGIGATLFGPTPLAPDLYFALRVPCEGGMVLGSVAPTLLQWRFSSPLQQVNCLQITSG